LAANLRAQSYLRIQPTPCLSHSGVFPTMWACCIVWFGVR